jgi:hypothetical protein
MRKGKPIASDAESTTVGKALWLAANRRYIAEAQARRVFPLPSGRRAKLAKIAWPDDRPASKFDIITKGRFLESGRKGPNGLSIDEFRLLVYQNRDLVFRQLGKWGIFQKVVDWFLEPEVAKVTPEWLDKQRRDLTWENLELLSNLMSLGYKRRAARLKGSSRSAENKRIRQATVLAVGKRLLDGKDEGPRRSFNALIEHTRQQPELLGIGKKGKRLGPSTVRAYLQPLSNSSVFKAKALGKNSTNR